MARPLRAAAAAALLAAAAAHCPNMCSGHGTCVGVNRCSCFTGWGGGDCSQRQCPSGKAWADVAVGDDTAHQPAECSARGTCDHKTGQCSCVPGFDGPACERLACPADCSGHGVCNTMKRHAATIDPGVLPVPVTAYTNVRAPFRYDLNWDAEMIQGCTCDAGYAGERCEQRVCLSGDDPMTGGQVDEVQLIRCDMDPATPGNQFTLSFGGAVTRPFGAGADIGVISSALEELPTIRRVSVAFSYGATFCDRSFGAVGGVNPQTQPAGGNIVSVTFLTEHGPALPRLVVLDQATQPLTDTKDNLVLTAAKGDQLAATAADPSGGVTVVHVRSVAGTKENVPCSGRGRCNEATGLCACFTGYGSSDGAGAKGREPDCGFAYLPIASCPGQGGVECSGHGRCSGYPGYTCTCDEGWGGGDCGLRQCPQGKAWFSYPVADNAAHALAECSGVGPCDRVSGQCKCDPRFEGAACERMVCPRGGPSGRQCSGHGRCLTMLELAAFGSVNGDPAPYTYGADPSVPGTWDASSVRGCRCDEGWTGPACDQRVCAYGEDITLRESDPTLLNEVQALTCSLLAGAGSGTFPTVRLSFRGEATEPIRADATAAQVRAALVKLKSIGGDIEVAYSRPLDTVPGPDSLCDGPLNAGVPNTVQFRFLTTHGPLPPIRVLLDEAVRDAITGEYQRGDGWTATQLQWRGGSAADGYISAAGYVNPFPSTGLRAQRVRPGTSGNAECSGRGLCNRDTGVCQCFVGFGASNGNRAAGDVENCGWREPHAGFLASK